MKGFNSLAKKLLVIVLVVALAVCSSILTVSSEKSDSAVSSAPMDIVDEYVQVASDGNLELYVNTKTTDFCVKNKVDGSEWYSTPQDTDDDLLASGTYKTEMKSLISGVYYDDGGVQNLINSNAGSVLDDNYTVETIDNGFRVVYNMESDLIELPLEVTLSEGALCVVVKTSELKVKENFTLDNISVLPYFLSGSSADNGYALVPDGCGGLISFDSDKTGIDAYTKRVYGENIANEAILLEDIEEGNRITLPVFGLKKNNSAVLCVMDKGESLGAVSANGAGNVTSKTNVFSKYYLFGNMEYKISSTATVLFEKNDSKFVDLSQKYYFLSGDNANYSGMAMYYRDLLIKNGTLKESQIETAPFLTVRGGITVKKSVFGFLKDTVVPLTTNDQVIEIAEAAAKEGAANPVINYTGWNKEELMRKSPISVKSSNRLKKEGVTISDLAESDKFTFVRTVDNIYSYIKGNNVFTRFTAPASNLANVAFFKKRVSQSTMIEFGKRTYFIKQQVIDKNFDKLIKSIKKNDVKYFGISDASAILYEDFGKTTMKRFDMQKLVSGKLKNLSEATKLVMDAPNAYALPYATEVMNVSLETGKQLLIDTEVPFNQMVLSGCVRYSTTPLNHYDINYAILKTLETGSMPHFFVYSADESTIKNTDYTDLSNGNSASVIEKLSKVYGEVKAVAEKVQNSQLVAHNKLAEGVFKSDFANGYAIIVNYNNADYTTSNGTTVSANGYAMEVSH